MLTRKINHTSPLSDFAYNAKAAQMRSIYTKALEEAKKEQQALIRDQAKPSRKHI